MKTKILFIILSYQMNIVFSQSNLENYLYVFNSSIIDVSGTVSDKYCCFYINLLQEPTNLRHDEQFLFKNREPKLNLQTINIEKINFPLSSQKSFSLPTEQLYLLDRLTKESEVDFLNYDRNNNISTTSVIIIHKSENAKSPMIILYYTFGGAFLGWVSRLVYIALSSQNSTDLWNTMTLKTKKSKLWTGVGAGVGLTCGLAVYLSNPKKTNRHSGN
jgi:hypothetical protein